MDRLEKLKRLRFETKREAIGNCLVLGRAPTEPKLPSISKILIEVFQRHRFAIGDPAFVPAVFYAKEVLDNGALKKPSRTLARLPSAYVLWLLGVEKYPPNSSIALISMLEKTFKLTKRCIRKSYILSL